jgi:cytochrome b561
MTQNTALYSRGLKIMHWLLALLIGAQLSLATQLPTGLHIFMGITIGCLTMWRFILRPEPDQLAEVHEPGSVAVKGHLASYALIALVCTTGFLGIMMPNLEDTVWPIHHFLAYSLAALIALHVAAGLYRQFILKDGTLERIK